MSPLLLSITRTLPPASDQPAAAAPEPSTSGRRPGPALARRRRSAGAIYESRALGRLEYVPMPWGRASFWYGHQRMPDSRVGLQIVCEVELDELPTAAHAATVVALRRNQVSDALACLPLINQRLRALGQSRQLVEEDLALAAIYLRPRPMIEPCYELEYHVSGARQMVVAVSFEHGKPRQARIEPIAALPTR